MNLKNAKTAFHALTVASAALATFGSVVPAKYAIYVVLVSSGISGLLNIITRLYPEAAQ